MPEVTTIISYSSLDEPFLYACLDQCSKFSQRIIVVHGTSLFDGTTEWQGPILDNYSLAFPTMRAVLIPGPLLKQMIDSNQGNTRAAHNYMRWHGVHVVDYFGKLGDAVLFVDADEIPDGAKMAAWLKEADLDQDPVHRFEAYWYFRSPELQATTTEESSLLLRSDLAKKASYWTHRERAGMTPGMPQPRTRGLDGLPMWHHFSWARSKENMLRKVSLWGHKHDRDWNKLIEEEFSHEFSGTDFVHGYQYRRVENQFRIGV